MSGSGDRARISSCARRAMDALPTMPGKARDVPESIAACCTWWGVRHANSAAVSPEEDEDFQGVELGGSIAQVARLGERRAGERAFQDTFRPHVRQPAHENRGTPAAHGEEPRAGE